MKKTKHDVRDMKRMQQQQKSKLVMYLKYMRNLGRRRE